LKLKYLLLITFTILLIGIKANAQTLELKGIVKDSLTLENLSSVSIYNLTMQVGTGTNNSGDFKIPVSFGNNVLKITHVGCQTKYLSIIIIKSLDTIIYMAHHQHDLDDIVVVGEKAKLIQLEKDKLNHDAIMISGTKPIASILDKMPGVSSLKTGYTIAKPMIQGMYGSRVIVMNNGIKQEGQQWGNEHGLEIDPYNTSRITLVKGAEALRYTGDAIGGILLVEPMPVDNTDTLRTTFTLAGTDNGRQGNISASTERSFKTKRFGTHGIRLQGTLKKGGNLNTPDYYLMNTGFEEQNGSVSIQLFKTKKQWFEVFSSLYNNKPGILTTSHIGNLTDLQKIIENKSVPEISYFSYKIGRPYQEIHHWLNKLKWFRQLSPSLNFEVVYGYQINRRKEYDSHNYFNNTSPSLDFDLHTQQLDAIINKTLRKGWFLKTGFNLSNQTNNYSGRFFIPNYTRNELSQFSVLRYRKNRHEIELGYRAGGSRTDAYKWEANKIAHYPLSYKGISWQAGWLYKLNTDWQLVLQAGKVWRNPNISELFSYGLHHGSAAIEYGSIDLKPEHSLSGTVIAKYRHNKTLFEGEIFVKQVKNYIYLKPKFPPELTIRGAFPAFNYTQTDAIFAGLDLFAEQQLKAGLSIIEKAGLLNVYDQNNPGYINGIPPYQFTHAVNYKLPDNKLTGSVQIRLSLQHVLTQKRYTTNTDYAPPPSGYILMNASINGNFTKYSNLLFFLTADNILNKNYRDYLNRFRYYADETGRMIVLGFNIKI